MKIEFKKNKEMDGKKEKNKDFFIIKNKIKFE